MGVAHVIGDYGDFAKVPECYFLKGFVYENNIKDIKQARIAYTEFITKFPNHDLRDDAEISMKNLGKTPEQIVREFEENLKRKSDSIAAAQKK